MTGKRNTRCLSSSHSNPMGKACVQVLGAFLTDTEKSGHRALGQRVPLFRGLTSTQMFRCQGARVIKTSFHTQHSRAPYRLEGRRGYDGSLCRSSCSVHSYVLSFRWMGLRSVLSQAAMACLFSWLCDIPLYRYITPYPFCCYRQSLSSCDEQNWHG